MGVGLQQVSVRGETGVANPKRRIYRIENLKAFSDPDGKALQ